MKTTQQERRRFPRIEEFSPLAVNLVEPRTSFPVDQVNLSRGGICLRLQEALEIHSTVKLQLTPERASQGKEKHPVNCMGRVAWVMQRLDLRDTPPFLFDVGIELVNPPALLKHFLADTPEGLPMPKRPAASRQKTLEPSTIKGRRFIPRLLREEGPAGRWHLVVMVDDVPCFSNRFASEREAVAAWAQFKRAQSRSTGRA